MHRKTKNTFPKEITKLLKGFGKKLRAGKNCCHCSKKQKTKQKNKMTLNYFCLKQEITKT